MKHDTDHAHSGLALTRRSKLSCSYLSIWICPLPHLLDVQATAVDPRHDMPCALRDQNALTLYNSIYRHTLIVSASQPG